MDSPREGAWTSTKFRKHCQMITMFFPVLKATAATSLCLLVVGCDAPTDSDRETAPEEPPASADEHPESESERTEEVIVVVNDRQINAEQVEQHLDRLGELYRHSDREFDESIRDAKRRKVIQRLIDRELLRDHIERRDLEIDDDQISDVMDRRIDARFGSSDSFRRYLDAHDKTISDFRERVREELKIEEAISEQADPAPISDEELREHYERIANRRPARDRLEATRLSLRIPRDLSDDEHEELYRELSQLVDDLEAPSELREVSERLSVDVTGDFQLPRWFERDGLPSQTEALLFEEAPPQGVAPVVKTTGGFDVYWLHDRREAGIRQFDEVEELLRERARRGQLERTRRELLHDLRNRAEIEMPRLDDISSVDESPK